MCRSVKTARLFFYVDGEKKSCRLERIHFEEDAGKLLHDEIDGTVVDFNRCGVPLIEMVTKPDLHSSAEAKEFLEMIKTTLSYLDICDCKMEEARSAATSTFPSVRRARMSWVPAWR